jgi:integrase
LVATDSPSQCSNATLAARCICAGGTRRSATGGDARSAIPIASLATVDAARTGRLTLAELFARYEREVSAHKKGVQPLEDRRRIALWTVALRGVRDVRAIDPPTLDRFVRDRRAGRIAVLGDDGKPLKLKKRPSDTTIGADLVFLNAVLNWACKVRTSDGGRLLSDNPLRGYPIPHSKNPKRPVASYDRYLAIRVHADQVDPQQFFGAFMDLIEALGWRVTAVCELLASDVERTASSQAPHGRIRKRGEVDKEGVDMWLPLSESARAAVDAVLRANPVIGARPLFPAPKAKRGRAAAPRSRFHARDLLERAEAAAELEPLDGGDFHAYRLAWATARKHLPAADVAHAGGWRDLRSLERSYQRIDDETLLAVVTELRKLRDVRGG